MTQQEIDKAFEGRWRIKEHVFSAEDHVQGEIKELCRDFFETGILIAESQSPVQCAANLPQNSFDIWWKMYDLKVGKENCMKKWAKLTRKEKAECIASTPAYVESTPDKQFRKRPLTYLNQKAWNDEIIPRNNGNNKPTIEQQRIDKLASILVG